MHRVFRDHPAARAEGLTVAELLATLAIAAVLTGVALPGLTTLVARSQADAAAEQMVGAVRFARHLAISRGKVATLCPGQGPTCGERNSWHDGALVSVDDKVVLQLPPLDGGFRATWNRTAKSLSMRPNGTMSLAGSLFICPPDADPKRARRLVVNQQGRIYVERDRDGDGVFDGVDRRAVAC